MQGFCGLGLRKSSAGCKRCAAPIQQRQPKGRTEMPKTERPAALATITVTRSQVLAPTEVRSRFSSPYWYAVLADGEIIGYVQNRAGVWVGRMADGTWPWERMPSTSRASVVHNVAAEWAS